MKGGLINAITGTKVQARTTPHWEKGECLYQLFDSGDIGADATRASFQQSKRKVILFTKPTDNFLHTSSGSGLKQAFLNMGCIMSLSHRCSGLRTSLCLRKEKGVCHCRLCLWGNRKARKGSDALWYSSPTPRPLQQGPLQHTTCLLSLNMQSK